jgi:peptidoglycan/LPS O-acetylase OafA/YrhL
LRTSYLKGLDGLRAIAVLSVVAYHLRFQAMTGGYLGVDAFFVLSGFLITTLLIEEHREHGGIAFGEFWRRRARRLLPALYVMLVVVCLVPLVLTRIVSPSAMASVDYLGNRSAALATFFYVANWHNIIAGTSYFAQFSAPSPLSHTWSLAIEEQFYIFWPFVTAGLVTFVVARRSRSAGVIVCAAIAGASTILMTVLYEPLVASTVTRVYFGTDTRLADLAVGAVLAWLVLGRNVAPRARAPLNVAGGISLVLMLAFFKLGGNVAFEPRTEMFRGGFLVFSILTAVLIAALRDVGGPINRLFSMAWLCAVGRVSYGLYLWHWPVIVYMNPQIMGYGGFGLLVTRIVTMSALTWLSYRFVEQPIRRRTIPIAWRRPVFTVGTVVTLALVIVLTIPALVTPATASAATIAQYAPTSPPTGSGNVQGLEALDATVTGTARVLLWGDSVTYLSGPGITAAVSAIPHVVFRNASFPGESIHGLPHYRDVLRLEMRLYHPQMVMMSTIWDAEFAYQHPTLFDRELQNYVNWCKGWKVKIVAFVGHPIRYPASFDNRPHSQIRHDQRLWIGWYNAWLASIKRVVAANPGVALYMPAQRAVTGGWPHWYWMAPPLHPEAPRTTWARVRASDGAHYCAPGTELYAAAIAEDVAITLRRPAPQGRWWLDGWQNAPNQFADQMATVCPADSP